MNTYKIHQISIRGISDEINKLGWDKASQKYSIVQCHLDTTLHGSDRFKPEWWEHYQHVADIDADDLDAVFAIGNGMGETRNIITLSPMHSVSVGDIVECPDGDFYMVNTYGFDRVYPDTNPNATRYALIPTTDVSGVAAYLPSGYRVAGTVTMPDGWFKFQGVDEYTLVVGKDRAGWTLDGYVLPRLGSGWFHGQEIDADKGEQLLALTRV